MKPGFALLRVCLPLRRRSSPIPKSKWKICPPPCNRRCSSRSATLVGLSKEVEKGKTTYEAETKVNGKSRDIEFDSKGAVLTIEEEIDLGTIPAAARTAIEQKAAGGTIKKVESVTHGGAVSYEAAVKTKAGKNIEIGVNADGSTHK